MKTKPNVLNPKITRVAKKVSAQLTKQGYKHALIGGLAVNRYGYPRTTDDVDFLVTSAAESDLTGFSLGGEVRGKTLRVDGVDVDLLFPTEDESFLENAIETASGKPPIISKAALIYMKMVASRMKDSADVVELLKRGKISAPTARAYLQKHRPDLVDDFDALVLQAQQESA